MAHFLLQSSKRILDPVDRLSEVLFGLIMVLTFTGSLSVADAGRDDVRLMLIGALGCNLAWGIIDGVFYLMGCLGEKGSGLATLHAVRRASDAGRARNLIVNALPPVISSVLQEAEIEQIHQRLKRQPEPPARARLSKTDCLGAVSVFLIVFFSTFPVAIPFLLMKAAEPAMRISNTIAMVMLFVAGYVFARLTGGRPIRMGIAMVGLGAILVALTIALGG